MMYGLPVSCPSGLHIQTISDGQLHPCSHMDLVTYDIKVYGRCLQTPKVEKETNKKECTLGKVLGRRQKPAASNLRL